jgi:hypothetical protein
MPVGELMWVEWSDRRQARETHLLEEVGSGPFLVLQSTSESYTIYTDYHDEVTIHSSLCKLMKPRNCEASLFLLHYSIK